MLPWIIIGGGVIILAWSFLSRSIQGPESKHPVEDDLRRFSDWWFR